MKSFELQPTDENILGAFEKDLLDRNIDVVRFSALLDSMEYGSSIALEGQWGSGKTFFVKQVKMVLDAFNEHITSPYEQERERIQTIWDKVPSSKKLALQPQVSVYYDAWLNDNDEDPILSLMYTILQSVSTDFEFKKGPNCIKIAASIADAFTGKNYSGIMSAFKSEDPMASLREKKSVHGQIGEFLESLLAEQGNRLVVFVDELDRCKPTFAVQLLERIKHYFSNDRITFVFSVNISELQHTIKRYYGSEFNASKYLDRFFDFRVALPPAKMEKFYQEIGLGNTAWVYEDICRAVIDANHFTLREIVKFYRLARTAAYRPTHDHSFGFGGGRAVQFCLMCVLPVMIGLKISNQTKYDAFVRGEDSAPLHKVLSDTDLTESMANFMLSPSETYEPTGEQTIVTFMDKLEQVYDALFVHQYTGGAYEVTIGKMSFRAETKSTLLKAVSALSDYADYNL